MLKHTILSLLVVLFTSLLDAKLTVNDNKYITSYNKETSSLSRNFGSMRKMSDYQDNDKVQKVEDNFKKIENIIGKFSNQNDRQVIGMKTQLKNNKNNFYKNLKIASKSKPKTKSNTQKGSNAKTEMPKESLTQLVAQYNKEINNVTNALHSMNSAKDFANKSKMNKLHKHEVEIESILNKIKLIDARTYPAAKSSYDFYKKSYKKSAAFYAVKTTSNSLSKSNKLPSNQKMTADDIYKLKKFRSNYIANDWMFRSIDSVKLQDSKYKKEFVDALNLLQGLLNPMRSKTFDRGVKRADADLKVIEEAYSKALGTSKKQASKAGDVDKQLEIVQQQFNKKTFDPRLQIGFDVIDDQAKVRAWASKLKKDEAMIPDILAFIEKSRANSIKARSPEFTSYMYWFKNKVQRELKDAKNKELGVWNPKIKNGVPFVEMKESSLQRDLKNQSRVKGMIEKYKVGKTSLANKMAFEKAYNGKVSSETLAMQKRYITFSKKLSSAMQESIKNQRLPKAVTIDASLMNIVKKLLPKLRKFGEISHMNAVSDVSTHKEYLFANGSWHIEITKTFTVSFVEKEGSHYFIKHVSLKYDEELYYGYINGKRKWYIYNLTPSMDGNEISKNNL